MEADELIPKRHVIDEPVGRWGVEDKGEYDLQTKQDRERDD